MVFETRSEDLIVYQVIKLNGRLEHGNTNPLIWTLNKNLNAEQLF
jgi:hypothetical protein